MKPYPLHLSRHTLFPLSLMFAVVGVANAQTTGIYTFLNAANTLKVGPLSNSTGSQMRSNGFIVSRSSGTTYMGQSDLTAGKRLIWHPGKAGLRAGYADATAWSESNFGEFSVAFGSNSKASGFASAALGEATTASGEFSTAMGQYSVASGRASTAMGDGAVAYGEASTAMNTATATGYAATAMGFWDTQAHGDMSLAAGEFSQAIGVASTALGASMASGYNAVAMGGSVATGAFSTSMGSGTAAGNFSVSLNGSADSYFSTAAGHGNVGGGNPAQWVLTDPLFEIGNTDPWASPAPPRKNALTVYKNGNMDVQGAITCAPGGDIPMFGE